MQSRDPRRSGKLSVHAVITAVRNEHNRTGASARLAKVMLELHASATSSSSPGLELCSVATGARLRFDQLDFQQQIQNVADLSEEYSPCTGSCLLKGHHSSEQCAFRFTPVGPDGSCDMSRTAACRPFWHSCACTP